MLIRLHSQTIASLTLVLLVLLLVLFFEFKDESKTLAGLPDVFEEEQVIKGKTYHTYYVRTPDNKPRTYLVHVPRSISDAEPADAENSYPLVVMVHGGGTPPRDFFAETEFNEQAEEHKFIVAYPLGTSPTGEPRHFCWDQLDSNRHCSATEEEYDLFLFKKMIEALKTDHAVDSERIFIAGFSGGSLFIQNRIRCTPLYEELAGVGLVSGGFLLKECDEDQPLLDTVFIQDEFGFKGPDDRTEKIHNIEDIFDCQSIVEHEAGTGAKSVTRYHYADCAEDTRTRLYALKGYDHVWPQQMWWESDLSLTTTDILLEFFGIAN